MNARIIFGDCVLAATIAFVVCFAISWIKNFFLNTDIAEQPFTAARAKASFVEPWGFFFLNRRGHLIWFSVGMLYCMLRSFNGRTAIQYIFEDSLFGNLLPDATPNQSNWFYCALIFGLTIIFRLIKKTRETATATHTS